LEVATICVLGGCRCAMITSMGWFFIGFGVVLAIRFWMGDLG
jgi:hypothetical protein